jgi:hypothetical protein
VSLAAGGEMEVNMINNNLEYLNIKYDILIDEEDYDNVNIEFQGLNLRNEWTNLVNLFETPYKKSGKVLNKLIMIDNLSNNKNLILNNVVFLARHICLWRYLFIAKMTRCIIQKHGSTDALKAMDEIAEYLLSKLFMTYESHEEKRQFRVLFYNEISQCYKGYLSIGYAEMALKEYLPGEYHYELLGLYNKAIGLAHHEDRKSREKALKYYEEIIDVFRNIQDNLGYKYDKYRINIRLWKIYVYFPAVIQKADVLIRLQQGQESIQLINTLEKDKENGINILTRYKRISALLLKAQAYVEMGEFDEVKRILFNNLFNNRRYFKKYRILWCKYKSIRAKYLIESVKAGVLISNKETNKKVIKSLSICKDLYLSAEKYGEKNEQIQAAIYWLEAFKLLDLNIILQSKERRNMLQLLLDDVVLQQQNRRQSILSCSVIGLLFEILILILKTLKRKEYGNDESNENNIEQWIPKRDEVINLLSKCLEKFGSFIDEANFINSNEIYGVFAKKEKDFCQLLINGFGNQKPSTYNRVKLQRRVKRLNLKILRENRDYLFPNNEDLLKVLKFTRNGINPDFYMKQLNYNTETFDEKLIYHSYWPHLRNLCAFTVLRKWQSFTPSLGSYSTTSRGGGYFLYKVGNEGFISEGIVVDPGYDFIENFFEHKFSVLDINVIVFTHSHIDHSDDFRGLITLIHEMNNRAKKEKYHWKTHKVRVILTPSCFDLFYQILVDCRDYVEDIIVVDDPEIKKLPYRNEIYLKEFVIRAVPAYHKEIDNEANCVGLTISKKDDNEKSLLGFTGDTVWTRTLAKDLYKCSVVCINMGALLDVRNGHCFEKNYKDNNQIIKLIYEQNHLYLPGTITVLEELRRLGITKIAIIGELGEELKSGLREDLYHKFNEFINKDKLTEKKMLLKIIVEDIGCTVTWNKDSTPQIRCFRCKKAIEDHNDVRLRLDKDARGSEQLYYYCKRCCNVLEFLETGVEENWQRRYLPPQ